MKNTPFDHTTNNQRSITEEFNNSVIQPKAQATIVNEPRFLQLKQISAYLNIDRPIISKDKKQTIEKKLQLERQTQIITTKRLKDNNTFVKYGYNPFINLQNKKYIKPALQSHNQQQILNRLFVDQQNYDMKRDIVEAVNQITNNNFTNNNKELNYICTQNQLFSRGFVKSTHAKFNQHVISNTFDQKEDEENQDFIIDDIVALADQNFYMVNQKQFNIFDMLNNKEINILSNSLLSKYYFSFHSPIEKLQHYKVTINRDLSQLSRKMTFNKKKIQKSVRLEQLSSHDMALQLKNIQFKDLINVSIGRLNPELIYNILYQKNAQIQISPSSSFIQGWDIPYNQNQNQNIMNHFSDQNQKQEVLDYLKLDNTIEQNRYERKYNNFYKNVKHQLNVKAKLCKQTIKDNNLHSKLNQLTKDDIDMLMKTDEHANIEMDRLIRGHKQNKNRAQHLKIKALLKIIVLKNQQEQKIKQLMLEEHKP